jgi:Tol biopolymer transport system component
VAAVDLTTEHFTRLFQSQDGHLSSVDVSPDGRTLALFIVAEAGGRSTTAVATMSVDGGSYREIYVTKQRPAATVPDQLQWARDGRSVFFQEAGRLMRISTEVGAPEYMGLTFSGPDYRFWVSPDGTRVAFNEGGALTRFSEVWAFDNLMSALKTAR